MELFDLLFTLWLIGGITLAVLAIIPTIMLFRLFFGKKVSIEDRIREEYERQLKYQKARNANPKPVYIRPKF